MAADQCDFPCSWPVAEIRSRFPALKRQIGGLPVCYFDGPAGSQVPQSVADAVADYLIRCNSNRGSANATAIESDHLIDAAHQAVADFLNAPDPATVCFGANMTTITLSVSRALSRTWSPGDEIIVTRLDHDANVSPWVLAARDAGAKVHHVDLNPDDWTLNLDDFRSRLSDRTRLVAAGLASNATGTINPIEQIAEESHSAGALVYADAVHAAPHRRIDVRKLNCDFLVCSAYKFFGPHVGILYGREDLLTEIEPYKLRPAPNSIPGRWMTGTQNHEGIVGTKACIDYLVSLNQDDCDNRRCSEGNDRIERLNRVFCQIDQYEQQLSLRFLQGIAEIHDLSVVGISNQNMVQHRVPTFSLISRRHLPQTLATRLAQRGIFAWAGNHYALPFTEAADLEPHGTLRIGALHYNTIQEIDRVIGTLAELVS